MTVRLPRNTSVRDATRWLLAGIVLSLLILNTVGNTLLWDVDVCQAVPGVKGAVALTFDDGPSPEFTPAILDILSEHDVRATFFVVGENVERYPEIVERIVAEGHEVANHTHTHPDVDAVTLDVLNEEFDRAAAALAPFEVVPVWYRPPRRELTFAQKRLAREHGLRVALWTRVLERREFDSAEEMAATLVEETQPGDILLAHDGRLDRSRTVEALPELLEGLDRRGLPVVTLTELYGLAEE